MNIYYLVELKMFGNQNFKMNNKTFKYDFKDLKLSSAMKLKLS